MSSGQELSLQPTVQKSHASPEGQCSSCPRFGQADIPVPCSTLLDQASPPVSAAKSVPGSPARVQPETHPSHSSTCIFLAGDKPLPRGPAMAVPAAGQPLVVGQGVGSPRQGCLQLAPCSSLAMGPQAGGYLAKQPVWAYTPYIPHIYRFLLLTSLVAFPDVAFAHQHCQNTPRSAE